MQPPKSTTVDAYIAEKSVPVRAALIRVRAAIRKAVPEAEETIAYQMPAYRLFGRPLLYFGGWKEHYALYPGSAATVAALKEELSGYEISKGTIRFSLAEPVPVALIARIARFRAKEASARANATLSKKVATRRVKKVPKRAAK